MITEDYVSFETAKLLKEKGFDEECSCFYNNIDYGTPGLEVDGQLYYKNSALDDEEYAAPTIQMAMKWLRNEYNLHIITLPYAPMDRHSYHPGEADFVYIAQLFKGIIPIDEIGRSVIKLTPEEACEAAIKYCLEKLI